jgi:hypothetical protein
VITEDSEFVTLAFDEFKPTVRVTHIRFPNGGSWSYFLCPSCARVAMTLRLYDGRLVCRSCDGLIAACQDHSRRGKEERIARLEARLAGKCSSRRRLEHSLKRARAVVRREALRGFNADETPGPD